MRRPTCITLCLTAALSAGAIASPLDDRIEAFSDASATQTEAKVSAILKTGIQEKRSAEALAAVQAWLNRSTPTNPEAIYLAGQAAEHAGQWLPAVGYYQRYLQQPKPDGKLAGPAVDATYRLLINALNDEGAAYFYMRKDGNRIRSFGSAKRLDRWFLDHAKTKRDLIAVADRLSAVGQDKSTNPADYAQDYEWLCEQVETFRQESAEVYAAAKLLADTPRTPSLYKARLNWAATVMPYNKKLDELRTNNAPADPKLTDAPLAAAAQLIKAAPDMGPILVAKGWGNEYDHGHSGNCAKRFEVEGQRKLDQLIAAVAGMSPDKCDDLLGYKIAQGRVKFDPIVMRDMVIKYPDAFNTFDATNAVLFDKERTTIDDAKKLAPLLARNPHPDAALIRAIASSSSLDFSVIAQALVENEAWRFDSTKPMIDLAWRNCANQDKGLKEVAKQFSKFGGRYDEIKKQIGKKADSKERLAAFNALRSDLLSQSPMIPGALVLWNELFTNAPDADTVQMIKTLVSDLKGERELLLKRALAVASFGKKRAGRMPWQAVVHDNQFRYHRSPTQKAGGELIAQLQGMVQKQQKAGALSETVFGMWLHTVDPTDPTARKLIAALADSPAYAKIAPAYRAAAADRHHFGHLAMTAQMAKTDPNHISAELLALPKDPTPKAVEAALATAIKRASSSPRPIAVIGLAPVAALPTWSDQTRRHVLSLFKDNAPLGVYPTRQGYEQLVVRLSQELAEGQRWSDAEAYLQGIWHAAASTDDARHYRGVAAIASLAEAAYEADALSFALSITRSGSNSRAVREMSGRNDRGLPEIVGRLSQVQGKASIAIGIIDIPVDERDPAYPIYKSQAEFAIGNTATAWDLYDEHAAQVQPIVRQLTVPYTLWLLERDIEAEESARAEALIRELTIWSREASGTFTSDQEAELKIAYADAAFQKGALQTAKAWYRRVADAEEFKGKPLQYKAMLRSIRVDRALKDFSGAMVELDKLMLVRDEGLRVQVHFAKAEVLFDQENYAEAFTEVSTVLKRDPSNADALILLGKAQLQMRKLVDASEIELGVSRDQKLIVPGEVIKINLNDPALNISGVGAEIEVEITTKSGDSERVMLYQLGDDKTKFRAEVPTALGPRVPGDKVLQVLGRDEIRYGYSKRFRAKMTDLPPDPDLVITVASDARLAATAGAFPPREGERKLDLSELGVSAAQQALGTRRVRPGNPVYLRVSDPDQGKTDGIDEVIVSITTSNGDTIPRVVLKETGPHTGEFQATVPTGPAQALAYASESAQGRDANMVISKQPYAGWAGEVGTKAAEQIFTIDLNDNVPLDKMSIQSDDPAQALTHFVLQTSMNGKDWSSRARFPKDPAPWTGRPLITAFPTYSRNSIAISEPEDRNVPEDWVQKMDIASAKPGINYGAFTVPGLSDMNMELPSGGHPGYGVVVRYRAQFYQPAAAIRTFRLTGFPADKNTLFLINGKPAGADLDDALTIQRELAPGLHEIEVWRHEGRSELLKRKPRLLCDVQGQAELAPCPDKMFDPASFPETVRESIADATIVTASPQTPNQFDIAFGERTRARLVRLVIVGHEGAAPSIKKINLTDRQGVTRLPVATDYQSLRQNGQLEVVPGDRVIVRYEDDRVVSPRRTIQQSSLSVAYNTATISASFLTYITTEEGRELVLEPIRRFKMDDSVGIVITDPDMDQTAEPDEITITVKSSGGATTTIVGLETGPNTGEFIGKVFPVTGDPARNSELKVPIGGTLIASYRDTENLDPGIPTDRTVTIEHARYTKPALAVYNAASKPLPVSDAKDDPDTDEDERGPEVVKPRRAIQFQYLKDSELAQQTPKALIGSSLRFDIVAPHLAFADSSEVVAYVQTDAGRKAYKDDGDGNMPFDVRVPGTMRLVAQPSRSAESIAPPGYVIDAAALPPTSRPAIDEGRFAFTVPIMLDDTPTRTYATKDAQTLSRSMIPDGMLVRPSDRLHVGFAYRDGDGEVQWLTTTVKLDSHAFLDVMNSRYRSDIASAYVGEKMYVRLIAPHLDRGPDRDAATVNLKAKSGATVAYQLLESEAHSGVFKGSFALGYADGATDGDLPPVALHGLPVKYDDQVDVSYPSSGPDAPLARSVSVNKGADGNVEPFSKRYGEDAVAIETTFTLAECFFELAKHHRKMDQGSLARREMEHAQKLLAEAVESHRDEDMQAHAEYLLGNLAQEYADLSKNQKSKVENYQDALARFSKIPLDYPDSEFAPKAQFKKGLIYEKLGEVDIAVEEYVKLAYKYPDHELIPSVMSRLGSYFQAQGLIYKKQAESLEAKEGDREAQGEAIKKRELATKEYINAAKVFRKLEERFPSDPLAGLAGLRSAQNYMRASDYEAAILGFRSVFDNDTYDGKEIRSQAMFWSGISYEKTLETQEAYQLYRRITFDFPDSVWAKRARGRLIDPAFARIIEAEDKARELLLEGLKQK